MLVYVKLDFIFNHFAARYSRSIWIMSSWVISLNVKEAGTVFRIGWMYSVVERSKEWQ